MKNLMILALFSLPLFAAEKWATLQGTVMNQEGQSLAKVRVEIAEIGMFTVTDAQGDFRLFGIQPGSYKLKVTYLEQMSKEMEVELKAGINPLGNIELVPQTEEELLVIGSLLEGQARALNDQRMANTIKTIASSDQLGSFPDGSAADSAQRLPGVNIQRDQGIYL